MAKSTPDGQNRITVEALRAYVPLYQLGDAAVSRLVDEADTLSPGERNRLETLAVLREATADKVARLISPLVTQELSKMVRNSLMRETPYLFEALHVSARDGMCRGLRKFDVDRLTTSSTNYLLQWVKSYAKRELMGIESAPFGVPPSRYQRLKKVAAVRAKLTEELGHPATNEEVYEYFQSGRADLKTMEGRVDKPESSAANRAITLEFVEEQEVFAHRIQRSSSEHSEEIADEVPETFEDAPLSSTLFWVFLHHYNFTDEARSVLLSELNARGIPEKYEDIAASVEKKEYQRLAALWRRLLRDGRGVFAEYLRAEGDSHQEFSTKDALSMMEGISVSGTVRQYDPLFVDGEQVTVDTMRSQRRVERTNDTDSSADTSGDSSVSDEASDSTAPNSQSSPPPTLKAGVPAGGEEQRLSAALAPLKKSTRTNNRPSPQKG